MLNRRPLLILALLLLLGAFGYGILELFKLRFAAGDVYPPYSSFRGDPLGCRVYFESLEQLGGTETRRFVQSLDKLPDGGAATLFVFGLPWNEMSAEPDEFKALESFVRRGGRLVVTLYPELARPRFFTSGLGTNGAAFKRPSRAGDEPGPPPINLREKWGFGYEYIPVTRAATSALLATRVEPGPFPTTMSWHSALVFTNLHEAWHVIFARGTNAVLIERRHGNGSIALATDSFFVSNEAMRTERAPDLLAWLAGSNREVLFDETHLGIQEKAGIATLARRYGLHGGVTALLALAALFIWKSSVSFLPRRSESPDAAPVTGRESAAGLENLLRRALIPKDLLQASLDEWQKSSRLDGRVTALRREKIRAVVENFNAQEKPNIVETYREITRILNHKQ